MITVRQATSPQELEATYRFRYGIYAEAMDGKQKCADHQKKTIVDPLDGQEGCCVLTALEGDEIVGTVRTNFLRSSEIGEYHELYHLRGLPPRLLHQTAITTRFMIHPRHRRRTLSTTLACEIFLFGLEHGITTDFIDCCHDLLEYFAGLGYHIHRNELEHPEHGVVTVMRLNLTDFDNLEQLGSPYLRIVSDWKKLGQGRSHS